MLKESRSIAGLAASTWRRREEGIPMPARQPSSGSSHSRDRVRVVQLAMRGAVWLVYRQEGAARREQRTAAAADSQRECWCSCSLKLPNAYKISNHAKSALSIADIGHADRVRVPQACVPAAARVVWALIMHLGARPNSDIRLLEGMSATCPLDPGARNRRTAAAAIARPVYPQALQRSMCKELPDHRLLRVRL